uniref:hypothetical protein n=1 Tax=Flavobacterium sp. TaxID=239 RepID=UPI00404816B1
MAIKIPIISDFNSRGVKDAESAFGKLGGVAKKSALALGGAAIAGAAIATKLALAGEEAATANARIEQIATSMGIFGEGTENSGTSVKQLTERLTKLAEATAMSTGVDQNQIKLTQAKLLTFKELATTADEVGGAFDRATAAAVDMSAAGFGDAASNAVQLGKALNDPVKGITALSRSGITFTAQQKKLIESLVATGRAGEAQNMILEAIETQVGGTAEATANASDKMKVAFSILQERIGTKLLPVFNKLSKFVIDKLIPGIEKFVAVFEKKGLKGVMNSVIKFIPTIQAKLKELGGAFVAWIVEAAPGIIAALVKLTKMQVDFLKNTVLPALASVLSKGANAFWDWIKEAAPPALKRLGELFGDLANWLLNEGLPMMVDKLIQLGNALVDWIKPQIVPALKALGELLLVITNWVVTEAVPKIGAQAVKLVGALTGWIAELLPEAVKGIGAFITELAPKIPGLFFKLIAAMVDIGGQLGGDLITALVDALKGLGSKGLDVGKSFANGIIRFINNNVIKKINDLLDFKISLPFGASFRVNPPDIKDIPELAEGGIVTSPTLAMIGEGRGPEAVIPLSKMGQFGMGGGGGITVNVNGGDPNSIVRALQNYVRQSGPVPLNTRAM